MNYGTRSTMAVFLFVLFSVCLRTKGLGLDEFYPFGKDSGDAELPRGTGGIHALVNLSSPVLFYGEEHRGLYVNLDGAISFDQPLLPFSKYVASRKTKHFPLGHKMVAPFYASVDTTTSGDVFYRETHENTLLVRATNEVRVKFAKENQFQASSAFIATWVKVACFGQQRKKASSFQVVLVSDVNKTFALFNYENRGGQHKTDRIDTQWLSKPFAEAGFSFGDELREFKFPGSGTNKACLFNKFSNINRPGKWVYMIGSRHTPEVKPADGHDFKSKNKENQRMTENQGCYLVVNITDDKVLRPSIKTADKCNLVCGFTGFPLALFHHVNGCMCAGEEILKDSYRQWNVEGQCLGKSLFTVYGTRDDVMMGDQATQETNNCTDDGVLRKCSENAVCKKSPIDCCVCEDGYYGNGKACSPDGLRVHLTGQLSGKINDVTLNDVKLSALGDILTRTTYLTLYPVASSIGWSLRVMMPLVSSLGFLFADPGLLGFNGFSVLGSTFVRRAKVTFETGEICYIKETFWGKNERGYFSFETEINGNFPAFGEQATIKFNDYLHSYRPDRLGVMTGFYRSSFNVGERKYKINVVEALDFDEDEGCLDIEFSKMAVSEQRSGFEDEILRFSMKTEMTNGEVKRCGQDSRKCDRNAKCIVKEGLEFCSCNLGFSGDGFTCQDVDECLLDIDDCSPQAADCVNKVGSFSCTCRTGYEGDGKSCRLISDEGLCGIEKRKCGPLAQCVVSKTGVENCECNIGYIGKGDSCQDADECELGIDICSLNAECLNGPGSYTCTCKNGFTGDGKTCRIIVVGSGDGCTSDSGSCGANEKCVEGICKCASGFLPSGTACRDADECELGIHHCHKRASCFNNVGSFTCTCNEGYEGDGYNCVLKEPDGCNGAKCHDKADCDKSGNVPICRCKNGYQGNGLTCADINECTGSEDLSKCHSYASCHNTIGSYRCECRRGYKGNGFHCIYDDPCKSLQCGTNSHCVLTTGSPMCQCYTGYYGNGKNCKDYNECEADRDSCDGNARCVNTAGSYKCFCLPGYGGDGYSCKSDGSCSGSKCHMDATCVEIDGSKTCQCNSGFIGSGLVCSDFDECVNNSVACPQFSRCINTFGSYKCRCDSGYQWNGVDCQYVCSRCLNGGTCLETGCRCREGYSGEKCQWVGDEFLMFSQGSMIQRLSLPPRQDTVGILLQTSRGLVVALDYDHDKKYIYFSDVTGRAIWRVRYNGTGAEKIITGGLASPEGVAVDYVGGNLYWTDSMFDRIEVAKLNGSSRKVLFSTRLINPRSIVVHPERGTLYWADWNRASPKIEVAHMDGGSRRVFIQQKMGLPNGLTIDRRNDELCWTDAMYGSISCAHLDDGNPQVIYSSARYPFGLTTFGQYLIWTDWSARTIQQYDRQTFKLMHPITSYRGSKGSFYDIKSVQQPEIIEPQECAENNGGCTNLCLPRPGGKTCACPNGFVLVNREEMRSVTSGSNLQSGNGTVPFFGGSGSGSGSGLGLGFPPVNNTLILVRLNGTICVPETQPSISQNLP